MICVLSLSATEDKNDVAWFDSLMTYQLQTVFDTTWYDRAEKDSGEEVVYLNTLCMNC
jgi:hypothetical protein